MKRDMDLMREILFAIEAAQPGRTIRTPDLEQLHPDVDVVTDHVRLLHGAGLVEGRVDDTLSNEPTDVMIERLTWEGHDFLDSIRSREIWARTKAKILEHGGAFTIEIVKAVAKGYAREALGLPPA